MAKFSDLLGKTLTSIEGATVGSECIRFHCDDGSRYKLFHYQDCCEGVDLNEIVGDIEDLLGAPITQADEACFDNEPAPDGSVPEHPESYTWTFYKLATVKGYVTLRWLGESNGYYSESVDFEAVQ
jgi:hypothetical protein